MKLLIMQLVKSLLFCVTMRRMACAKTVTCRVLYGFAVYYTSTEKRKG
jgi:hypothetical protein